MILNEATTILTPGGTKQKELSRVHLYAYYRDNFEVLLEGVWVRVGAYGPFPKI